MRYFFLFIVLFLFNKIQAQKQITKAIYLQDIDWLSAKSILNDKTVVVIPSGAGAKEHGPHLPLSADLIQAEYFKRKIAESSEVVIAPTLTYHFYPLFLQYAGSTSISYTTARNMTLEVIRSLAGYGVRRFYIINIGISTIAPLAEARNILLKEGIVLSFSFLNKPPYNEIEDKIKVQATGTHADELETSNILFMHPQLVNMSKAADDTSSKGLRNISWTPVPQKNGTLTTTGIFGYATLATKEKGKRNADALTKQMLIEIDSVRNCLLPEPFDYRKDLEIYAGTYVAPDGKELIITVEKNFLNYTWNKIDHSSFYRLNKNGNDRFGSQMLDVLFLKDDGKSGKGMDELSGSGNVGDKEIIAFTQPFFSGKSTSSLKLILLL